MSIPQLVVVGDGGVGKTSLIIRYTRNSFTENYEPTLEDNYKATIDLGDQKVEVEIADTAGQDEYKSLRDRYVDQGKVFLVVYSIADSRTLSTAKEILNDIKTLKESDFKFVLVGNKSDVTNRNVPFDDGKAVAKEFGGAFFETSAKKDINVTETFKEIGKLLIGGDEKDGGCCRI